MTRITFISSAALILICTGAHGDDPCTPHWDHAIGQPGMDQILTPPWSGATVRALTVWDDGGGGGPALYAGGAFDTADGQTVNYIARWDGQQWHGVGGGMSGVDFFGVAAVLALETYDDGSAPGTGELLFAGGSFLNAGGVNVNGIARWDGSTWSNLGQGITSTGSMTVFGLRVWENAPGGPALFVCGNFTSMDNQPGTNRLAMWDGTQWSGLFGGFSQNVLKMEVFDDGSGEALYVAGVFGHVNGEYFGHVARWNGQEWSKVGGGLNSNVTALAVFDDGSGPALYAGGYFGFAEGQWAPRIAKWNGSNWSVVGGGLDGPVRAMQVFDDGSGSGPALYVGGDFTLADEWNVTGHGPVPVSYFTKWDGERWHNVGGGTDDIVWSMGLFNDGASAGDEDLYVGGWFNQAGGETANSIATWRGCPLGPGIPGDLNGDGSVGVADLLILLSMWGPCAECTPASCPADLSGDCNVGVADLLILLANWG